LVYLEEINHQTNNVRIGINLEFLTYSTVTNLSERDELNNTNKSLSFTIQISGTNLNYYPEYTEHQKYLYEKSIELQKLGFGYRRIGNWFNERNIRTFKGSKFNSNYVYSIIKKGNIRMKRNNRTFKPIIKDLGIVIN